MPRGHPMYALVACANGSSCTRLGVGGEGMGRKRHRRKRRKAARDEYRSSHGVARGKRRSLAAIS